MQFAVWRDMDSTMLSEVIRRGEIKNDIYCIWEKQSKEISNSPRKYKLKTGLQWEAQHGKWYRRTRTEGLIDGVMEKH